MAMTAYTVAEDEKTIFFTPNSTIACQCQNQKSCFPVFGKLYRYHLKKICAAGDIVCIVLQWLRHRLTHRLESSKMDHTIWSKSNPDGFSDHEAIFRNLLLTYLSVLGFGFEKNFSQFLLLPDICLIEN